MSETNKLFVLFWYSQGNDAWKVAAPSYSISMTKNGRVQKEWGIQKTKEK